MKRKKRVAFTILRKIARSVTLRKKVARAYPGFKACVQVEKGGCWIPCKWEGEKKVKRKGNDDGYVSVCLAATNKNGVKRQVVVYLHHLSWWSSYQFKPKVVKNLYGNNEDMAVSHLCGKPNCFNPAHLVEEPLWVNIYRRICRYQDECLCDRGRKGEKGIYRPCLDHDK